MNKISVSGTCNLDFFMNTVADKNDYFGQA